MQVTRRRKRGGILARCNALAPNRAIGNSDQRQLQREYRATTLTLVVPEVSTHRTCLLLRQRKAQAGRALAFGGFGGKPDETLEQPGLVLLADAGAAVHHLHPTMVATLHRGDRDGAVAGRVLDGIGYKVLKYVGDAGTQAGNDDRFMVHQVQRDVLRACRTTEQVHDFAPNRPKRGWNRPGAPAQHRCRPNRRAGPRQTGCWRNNCASHARPTRPFPAFPGRTGARCRGTASGRYAYARGRAIPRPRTAW